MSVGRKGLVMNDIKVNIKDFLAIILSLFLNLSFYHE